jgi:hypothetical protein
MVTEAFALMPEMVTGAEATTLDSALPDWGANENALGVVSAAGGGAGESEPPPPPPQAASRANSPIDKQRGIFGTTRRSLSILLVSYPKASCCSVYQRAWRDAIGPSARAGKPLKTAWSRYVKQLSP